MITSVRLPKEDWSSSLRDQAKGALQYAKYVIKAAPLMYPCRVECNVCQWQGKCFTSDAWHKHTICPRCRASVRHRLMFAALTRIEALSFEALVEGRRVLHFAPEPVVQQRLQQRAGLYLTADYHNPRRDLRLDISDMRLIDNGEFDLLIACDVLEHVPDDRRAMRDIFRVLSPGGYAILTVPQKDGLAATYEDLSLETDEEREREFGQGDHVRIYGDDFTNRLEEAGFEVSAISENDLAAEDVQRHVLFPPELSPHPLATNHRKVFFARRPVA